MLRTLVFGLLVVSTGATAQFPAKPVRVVVPFPAGSSTDIITRVLAQSVSQGSVNRTRRTQALRSAAQDRGIARLEA